MNIINEPAIIRQCIQKVATGPEYSKDLDFDEAKAMMEAILTGEVDPVQIAVLFIALRMKRETNDENRGILSALVDKADIVTANVDEILDLCDPYDGYARGVPASPFVPMVLAAMGVNAVTHGLNEVGPKCGVTFHKVYHALGLDVGMTTQQAANQIDMIGWAYVDQSRFIKPLHDLIPLRQRMIKRQVLTTVETMVGPIRGKKATHLIGGYVHKAYPPIYEALARESGFNSAIFVRGVEGGMIPSLQQKGRCFYYHGNSELELRDLEPQSVGITAKTRALPLPDGLPPAPQGDRVAATVDSDALAAYCANVGKEALAGKKGLMYDSLVYSSAICLTHINAYNNLQDAAEAVRKALDLGLPLAKLEAASKASS